MSERVRSPHPSYVEREILAAYQAEARGKPDVAFSYLMSAHILGQTSTVEHVRVHWHMFLWSIRQRNVRECLGQLLRIVGAAIGTAAGLVPKGNTGGTNVNSFKSMQMPPELAALIEKARISGDDAQTSQQDFINPASALKFQ